MELADYLRTLDPQWIQRNDITLPDALTTFLKQLAEDTETAGLEQGTYLLLDPNTREFTHGDVAVSPYKDHMDIPPSDDPRNFGDVHGHPSKAVGHDGGYSAHSAADLTHFGNFKDRNYFLQFVASGPMAYAMIYVKGKSTWTDAVNAWLVTEQADVEEANRQPLYHVLGSRLGGYVVRSGTRDQYFEGKQAAQERAEAEAKATGEEDEEKIRKEGAEKYDDNLRKQVPDYGKTVERNSIDSCERFAQRWGYQFLTWKWNNGRYDIIL